MIYFYIYYPILFKKVLNFSEVGKLFENLIIVKGCSLRRTKLMHYTQATIYNLWEKRTSETIPSILQVLEPQFSISISSD